MYAKDRQRENFSKEALYSSEKMNKRLVSDDEINMNYSIDLESVKTLIFEEKLREVKDFHKSFTYLKNKKFYIYMRL